MGQEEDADFRLGRTYGRNGGGMPTNEAQRQGFLAGRADVQAEELARQTKAQRQAADHQGEIVELLRVEEQRRLEAQWEREAEEEAEDQAAFAAARRQAQREAILADVRQVAGWLKTYPPAGGKSDSPMREDFARFARREARRLVADDAPWHAVPDGDALRRDLRAHLGPPDENALPLPANLCELATVLQHVIVQTRAMGLLVPFSSGFRTRRSDSATLAAGAAASPVYDRVEGLRAHWLIDGEQPLFQRASGAFREGYLLDWKRVEAGLAAVGPKMAEMTTSLAALRQRIGVSQTADFFGATFRLSGWRSLPADAPASPLGCRTARDWLDLLWAHQGFIEALAGATDLNLFAKNWIVRPSSTLAASFKQIDLASGRLADWLERRGTRFPDPLAWPAPTPHPLATHAPLFQRLRNAREKIDRVLAASWHDSAKTDAAQIAACEAWTRRPPAERSGTEPELLHLLPGPAPLRLVEAARPEVSDLRTLPLDEAAETHAARLLLPLRFPGVVLTRLQWVLAWSAGAFVSVLLMSWSALAFGAILLVCLGGLLHSAIRWLDSEHDPAYAPYVRRVRAALQRCPVPMTESGEAGSLALSVARFANADSSEAKQR